MAKAKDFEVAEHLDSPDAIAAYLSEAFETGDGALIAQAIGTVARVKGMSTVTRETGLNRESLYRSLSEGGSPALTTILKVLHAFGVKLVPKSKDERHTSTSAALLFRKRQRFRRARS